MDIRISSIIQTDMSKYVKEAINAENIEQSETQQESKEIQTEIQDQKTQTIHYDELKTALTKAKVPITEDNIKLAEVIVKSGIELQKENIETLKDLKKQVEYIVNHISEKSVATALNDGIDLEKITLNVIENIVKDVNSATKDVEASKKAITKEEIKIKTDKFIEENKNDESLNSQSYELINKCIEQLSIYDLPITSKNVQYVLSAIEKTKSIENTDEKIALSLVQKELPATIENIYLSQHSYNKNSNIAKKQISDKDWASLLPQLEKIIDGEKALDKDTKDNAIKTARLLLENDLPVTAENIEKILSIKDLDKENINTDILIEEAVKNIKLDKSVSDIELSKLLEAEKTKADFTDQNIEQTQQPQKEKVILPASDNEIYKNQSKAVKDKNSEPKNISDENKPKNSNIEKENNKTEALKNSDLNTEEIKRNDNIKFSDLNTEKIKENNTKILKNIQKYDEETIKKACENTEGELTIKDLQLAYEQLKSQKNDTNEEIKNLQQEEISAEEIEKLSDKEIEKQLKTITAKRQLAEIQLRMTSETSAALAKKGINIDTVPLKELVKELKAAEEELYKAKLSQAGAQSSPENVEQLKKLYNKLSNMTDLTPVTYKEIIHKDIPFTINAVSQSEEKNKTENLLEQELLKRQQQAAQSYENLQTQPNAKFGDSFAKVSSQVEHVLEELEIETTPENIRAAKILIKNKMEVTQENVKNIKLIDTKVTTVTTQLHPIIAANMIKDGLKPVDMKVDDVISYMNKFKELLGQDLTDKLAQYIYELDENKELTQQQRDTMIGIYRMLYSIEKTHGRATGFVIKNEQELTLKNLMEASQYYDRTSAKYSDIDVKIDENFGELEKLVINPNSIKAQLNRAYEMPQQPAQPKENIQTAPNTDQEKYTADIQKNTPLHEKPVQEKQPMSEASVQTSQAQTDVQNNTDSPAPQEPKTIQNETKVTEKTVTSKTQPSKEIEPETEPKVISHSEKTQAEEKTTLKQTPAINAAKKEMPEIKALLKEIDFNTAKEAIKEINNISKAFVQEFYDKIQKIKTESAAAQEDIQPEQRKSSFSEMPENTQVKKTMESMTLKEFSDILEKTADLTPAQKDELINIYTQLKQPAENKEAENELAKLIIKAKPDIIEKAVQKQPDFEKTTVKQFAEEFEKAEASTTDEPVKFNISKAFNNIRNNIRPLQGEIVNKSNEINQIFAVIKQSSLPAVENLIFDKNTLNLTVTEFIKTFENLEKELESEEINRIKDFGLNSSEINSINLENSDNKVISNKDKGIENTIKNTAENQAQTSNAYFENIPYEYEQTILESFIENSQPRLITELVRQYPNMENMPLETLLKAMETVQNSLNTAEASELPTKAEEKNQQKTEEFINRLDKIYKADTQALLWLKNNDIPLTISNIEAMNHLLKEPFAFGNQLKEFSKNAEEKLGKGKGLEKAVLKTGLEKLKNGAAVSELLEDIEHEISRIKKETISIGEYQRQNLWKQASDMEKSIEIQKAVQKEENIYQIPVELHSGLTSMNIYVMNDREGMGKIDEKNMSVFISMETETLGNVQIYMKISDKNLGFQINTDKPEATKYLQVHKQELQKTIENLGYMVGKLNYGQEEAKNPLQAKILPNLSKQATGKNISADGFEMII